MKKETVKDRLFRQAISCVWEAITNDDWNSFPAGLDWSQMRNKDGNIIDLETIKCDTNGKFTFYAEEWPGWVFGVQFNPYKQYTSKFIKFEGRFFAQIDYPGRIISADHAVLVVPFYYYYDDTINREVKDAILQMLVFIDREPALAICRDIFEFDYNAQYISRETAVDKAKRYLQIAGFTADKIKEILKETNNEGPKENL